MDENEITNSLGALFRRVASFSISEYVFTLLRVEGIAQEKWSEFTENTEFEARILKRIEQYEAINKGEKGPLLELLAFYAEFCSSIQPYNVVANMLRILNKKCYILSPYGSRPIFSFMAQPAEPIKPMVETIRELVEKEKDFEWLIGFFDFIDENLIDCLNDQKLELKVTQDSILIASSEKKFEIKKEELEHMVSELSKFYQSIVSLQQNARMEFKKFKDKSFSFGDYSEEFHFLVNEEVGLYGFEVKYPSARSSKFERINGRTNVLNMIAGRDGIEFWVGDLDEFKSYPTLHAVKNPESVKYSPKGEWKPIIYAGGIERIDKMMKEKNVDEQVEGCLFYILTTGYKVIEFVAKMRVKLTDNEIQFENGVNLFLCNPADKTEIVGRNEFVYDGWLRLENDNIETIREAINKIAVTMNTLSLAFESPVTWILKYNTRDHRRGFAQPSKDDLKVLNELLKVEGKKYLLSAIDWYTRGHTSQDSHTKFLCFWVALEGLAQSIYNESESPWAIKKETQEELESKAKEWFKQYKENFENVNLREIFRQGYFEFTEPVRKKIEAVLSAVFAPEKKVVEEIFAEKVDNLTIWGLRGKLAHKGLLSDWGFVDEQIVLKRVGILEEIARSLILRVALKLKPSDPLPQWGRLFGIAMSGFDPRSCMVASTEKVFPTGDWKIKPEWIE